jgi:hypothetical protein
MNRGHALLTVTLLIVVAVFLFVDPYPQPQSYHAFADDRTLFGVANFWNVATNAVFLVPGIAGLLMLRSADHPGILPGLNPAYHILFTGILLTAIGSAWFHLAPNNHTLFWDRLPMTIAFMSLAAIIVGEHVSESLGRRLLWPLLRRRLATVWTGAVLANAADSGPSADVQIRLRPDRVYLDCLLVVRPRQSVRATGWEGLQPGRASKRAFN